MQIFIKWPAVLAVLGKFASKWPVDLRVLLLCKFTLTGVRISILCKSIIINNVSLVSILTFVDGNQVKTTLKNQQR